MFPQPDLRPVRRLTDLRDLAGGLTVAGLLAIVVAGGAGIGMGSPAAPPYMRVAEQRSSLCDAVLDPIHPAVGAQHLRLCLERL
ncbi:hypothetical protein [Aliihoeflea sp. 40Bstr573]|uniref:hypothetical protein n=1 Tax=Aliihoeflea sp. 40Bstr573 TaxID=2696467 RepID=UPI002095732C|nr:hypothetical protein [Aliihoeflea sp. 40Bstr573]MCO6387700.1 hypothetical protein [Aliihoeflea sp. 40Bstr573]